MVSFFDSVREISLYAVLVRMVIAVLCGGFIGIEREYKRRPAGFRTHILICLGASMTTLTSQYLVLYMNYFTDMGRLGAQVVAGIGFVGAGTIIVSRGNRVKGLTTAAGLWTAAIIGLALGCGFYEGALFATGAVLLAELVFSKWEYRLMDSSPEINLYMEYTDASCLERVLKLYRGHDVKVLDMEITRSKGSDCYNASVIFSLRLNKKIQPKSLLLEIQSTWGVITAEEL